MEIHSVMVTGANRGIGLEFVKQLVKLPKPPKYVIATYRCRDTAKELKALRDATKNCMLYMVKMDVTRLSEIQTAKKITEDLVGEKGITLLVNNAGVGAAQAFPQITEENLKYHFKVNTVGPVLLLQEFLPLLQTASNYNAQVSDRGMSVSRAAVLNISSHAGCITEVGDSVSQLYPGYKISKAALNMAMRVFASNVKEQGILLVNMCPGWVKTTLGTDAAELEPHESIAAMLKTLPKLNEEHHGSFMDRFGNYYPF